MYFSHWKLAISKWRTGKNGLQFGGKSCWAVENKHEYKEKIRCLFVGSYTLTEQQLKIIHHQCDCSFVKSTKNTHTQMESLKKKHHHRFAIVYSPRINFELSTRRFSKLIKQKSRNIQSRNTFGYKLFNVYLNVTICYNATLRIPPQTDGRKRKIFAS